MTREMDIPEEELLLPWYVSGRLEADEQARVEQALKRSPELRQALEEERRLQAAVATAPLPLPREIDPDALLAAAAAKEAAYAPSRAPRWLKPALAAAIVVAVVEGVALAWLSPTSVYRTASGPVPKITIESTRYAVHFVEDTSVARVREALAEAEAGIIRGPMPDGAYILETAKGERALDRLKQSGVMRTIALTD